MASNSSSESSSFDQYAQVSSFYGPGTVAAWYFTALSVLMSWQMHPTKRHSNGLDVDFVTTLATPTIAAGHLMFLVLHSPQQGSEEEILQHAAAVIAPITVVGVFIPIGLMFCWTAIIKGGAWKAFLMACVFCLCCGVKTYSLFTKVPIQGPRLWPKIEDNRISLFRLSTFVTSFGFVWAESMIILVLRIIYTIFYKIVVPCLGIFGVAITEDVYIGRTGGQMVTMASLTTCIVFVGMILSDMVEKPTDAVVLITRLQLAFIPQTACSITDLDQAVAAGTGALILAFNAFKIIRSYGLPEFFRRN